MLSVTDAKVIFTTHRVNSLSPIVTKGRISVLLLMDTINFHPSIVDVIEIVVSRKDGIKKTSYLNFLFFIWLIIKNHVIRGKKGHHVINRIYKAIQNFLIMERNYWCFAIMAHLTIIFNFFFLQGRFIF